MVTVQVYLQGDVATVLGATIASHLLHTKSTSNLSRGRIRSRPQMQLVREPLCWPINSPLAFSGSEDASLVVSKLAVEVSTLRGEVFEVHGLVGRRLVDDGCLVSGVLHRDFGVDCLVVVSVALDDGLHDVVDMVGHILVNGFSTVDDRSVGAANSLGVAVLGTVARQEVLVGGCVDVGLFDVRDRVGVLGVFAVGMVSVQDGLDVVLDVVHMAVMLPYSLDLFGLVSVVRLFGHSCEVLVVMGRVGTLGREIVTVLDVVRVAAQRRLLGMSREISRGFAAGDVAGRGVGRVANLVGTDRGAGGSSAV